MYNKKKTQQFSNLISSYFIYNKIRVYKYKKYLKLEEHFETNLEKWKTALWSDEWKFENLFGKKAFRLKRRGTIWLVFSSKFEWCITALESAAWTFGKVPSR